jgi:hypothetical protein
MSTKRTRESLIDALVQQYRQQLEALLPKTPQTLDQIEEIAGKLGKGVSREIEDELSDPADEPRDAQTQCSCGQPARYKGKQPRQVVTLHGMLTVRRAVYYCRACQRSFAPHDRVLHLASKQTTTAVRNHAAYLAALLPFAQAATTLEMLTQITLSPASVERIACVVGKALRREQQTQVAAHHADRLPEPMEKSVKRLYIGMDGVFVPLREEWKRDGGKGALTCRYGECKLGVVYEAKPDATGRDGMLTERAYTATLENAEVFGPQLATLAHQQGHHQTQDVVVLADGAAWIWQIAGKQFTQATQIVDFYHASEHLAQVADARFGPNTAEGKAWLSARQAELLDDKVKAVLEHLRAWQPSNKSKKELRRTTYNYFAGNAHRMQYKTFRDKGYYIGSGVVEAGCKHVVTQRMKLAGMHWRQETAEAILALRTNQLSSHPKDLYAYCAMTH